MDSKFAFVQSVENLQQRDFEARREIRNSGILHELAEGKGVSK